ncbi:hypothetical protein MRX96_055809 [Rhipicephalus microplus]
MRALKTPSRIAISRTLVCVALVSAATMLFTEPDVAHPEIGNAKPFDYTVTTQQNLSVRTPSLRQRHAPRKVTPRPNFCSVNWKQGSDLLQVKKQGPPLLDLEKAMPHVMPGGRWFPTGCTARHRVAIVVPYRDRLSNLQAFLQHMHPFLQSQRLDYGIYVVEQNGSEGFNRAKLFNAGFEIVKAMHNHSCFIFHDVDLLPENRRNVYACRDQHAFHFTTCLDKWKYTVIYPGIFGGVVAMQIKHMEMVNGFSNLFSKWGAEDDDMARRLHNNGLPIMRNTCTVGRYTALSHSTQARNPIRNWLLRRSCFRSRKDGLNSLEYTVLDIVFKKLYTHILVDISYSGPIGERNSTHNLFMNAICTGTKDAQNRSDNVSELCQ